MSDRPDLHVGDSGIPIVLIVQNRSTKRARDISAATNMRMIIQRPNNGSSFEVTATLYSDGSDGKMQWVILPDYIDDEGDWLVQGFLDDGGANLHTDIETFVVGENLQVLGS